MKLAASGAGEDEEKALATSNPISPVNSQTQIMVSGMDEWEDMEGKRDKGETGGEENMEEDKETINIGDSKEDARQEEEMEESRKLKIANRPTLPTQEEVEEHQVTHWPTRDWCEHCVKGKAVSSAHKRSQDKGEIDTPTISIDYCFMAPEEREEGTIPILAVYDNKTKAIRALPCAAKGTDEEAVKWLVDIIEEMGYVGEKIVLKSDQEPSILALKRAVAVTRDGQTCPIESPVRESKSNGAASHPASSNAPSLF